MAGYPRSDLEADNWQTIAPDDWSWIDTIKGYGYDAGNALFNLGSNVAGGLSPIHPDAAKAGAPNYQIPPILSSLADSYSRLAGTPSRPGNAYDLTGVKELDAPIQQDMSNVLLSLYGGNALAVTKPKGALGAGAMREAGPTGNALASHRLEDSQMPMQPQAVQMGDDLAGRMPDLSHGQQAPAPRSLIENDPYLKAWADHLGLSYDGLLSPAIAKALADGGDHYYYGIRTTPYQVNAGSIMPDSTQWYQDAVPVPFKDLTKSERRDVVDGVGHYLSYDEIKSRSWDPNYLDHGDPLGGSSAREFIHPLRKPTADSVETARGYSQYGANGDFVHLVRSKTVRDGLDRNEWIMPDAEVVAVAPYSETLFSDTGKPSLLGSALATAGEQPRTVKAYHSTPAQFDKFDNAFTDELGFHFGSKNQAHNRAYVQSGGNPLEYFFKWRDIPVEMDIKKAAQISGDVGKFDGPRMAQQLVRDGIAPYDLIASVMDAPKASQNGIVRDWLVNNGYDAVKYPNTFEGVGDPSYMALGTGNVRHAKTGQVLYSDGVPVPQNQQSDYDLTELLRRYGVSY